MNLHQVREVQSLRPRLREDVRLHFRKEAAGLQCVLEDPLRSRYHQLGVAETQFLQELNGKRSFAEAYARACAASAEDALQEEQALQLLGWLIEQHLVHVGSQLPGEPMKEEGRRGARQRFFQGMNLISIRVPFGSPAKLLAPLRVFSPLCCSIPILLLGSLIVLAATLIAWSQPALLAEASQGLLAPNNWLRLAVVWIGLKLWHEAAHAMTCMHYGGRIREAGILFILLMPLGYVDASESLAFSSKWKRMHVAAAGMMAELLLAALAFFLWLRVDPGPTRELLFNVATMGSVITLLFNLNPLMRFDGYYLLCDLINIPNLGTRSQHYLRYLSQKLLLGMKELSPPELGEKSPMIYLIYGLAAWLWRILILLTLLTAASLLLGGGGWLLVLITLASMAAAKLQSILRLSESGFFNRIRWQRALPRILIACTALMLIMLIPVERSWVLTGVFRQENNLAPRPEGDGILKQIHVQDGQQIQNGDPLLTLSNPDTELRLALAKLERGKREIQLRQASLSGFPARMQAEAQALDSLEEQIEELQAELNSLQLEADTTGQVLSRHLHAREGMWISSGTELLQLQQETEFMIHVAIPQDQADAFREREGAEVELLLESGASAATASFIGMDGRATQQPGLPELTAAAGGPIPIRPSEQGPEWLSPVFIGRVQPDPASLPRRVRVGERVKLRFRDLEAENLWQRSRRLIRQAGELLLRRAEERGDT